MDSPPPQVFLSQISSQVIKALSEPAASAFKGHEESSLCLESFETCCSSSCDQSFMIFGRYRVFVEKSESLQHGGTWKGLRSAVCLPVVIEMNSSVRLICSLENTVSSHCPIFALKNHGVLCHYVGARRFLSQLLLFPWGVLGALS